MSSCGQGKLPIFGCVQGFGQVTPVVGTRHVLAALVAVYVVLGKGHEHCVEDFSAIAALLFPSDSI